MLLSNSKTTQYLIMLGKLDSPCLEALQLLCWFAYGAAILATGGTWLIGELYQGPPDNPIILSGGLLLLLMGLWHGAGIIHDMRWVRVLFARVACFFWAALGWFYLMSPTHKIGVVMCALLLLTQTKTVLWLWEVQRRERLPGAFPYASGAALHRGLLTPDVRDHLVDREKGRSETSRSDRSTHVRTRRPTTFLRAGTE